MSSASWAILEITTQVQFSQSNDAEPCAPYLYRAAASEIFMSIDKMYISRNDYDAHHLVSITL